MTATPDEHILVQLRQLVYRLRAATPTMQRSIMLSSALLRENIAARHWFVTHANDSWQLDGEQFRYYIRDFGDRLPDFQSENPTFFDDRSELNDETQFVYRASIWALWHGRYRLLMPGKADGIGDVLDGYLNHHLVPQARQLFRRGILYHPVFTVIGLPLTIEFQTEGFLYGLHVPTVTRERLLRADRMTGGTSNWLHDFTTGWNAHFVKYWLPVFLSPTEYAAAKDLHVSVLAELYPDIHCWGPRWLRDAHHDRVWGEIIYDLPEIPAAAHA